MFSTGLRFAAVWSFLFIAVMFLKASEPDRERRVKVAVTLSTVPAPTKTTMPDSCGVCVPLEEARIESLKTGKPIVCFVGGCSEKSKQIPSGVISARVGEYDLDEKGKTHRIVLIYRDQKDKQLYYMRTLPFEVDQKELLKNINDAKTKSGVIVTPVQSVPLNWNI